MISSNQKLMGLVLTAACNNHQPLAGARPKQLLSSYANAKPNILLIDFREKALRTC